MGGKWSKEDIRKVEIITISLCIVVLFYGLLGKIGIIWGGIRKFLSALTPLVWGCVIAFLLTPLLNLFLGLYNKLFAKILKKAEKEKIKKVANICSVITTIILFIAIIASLLIVLIPQLRDSIVSLYGKVPVYAENVQAWAKKVLSSKPELYQAAMNNIDNLEKTLTSLFSDKIMPNMDTIVVKISSGIIGGIKFVFNFAVGIIIAVYILYAKDSLVAQCKKIIYSIFDKKRGNKVLDALDFTNSVFGGFINGKIIDSIIIGFLAAIFLCGIHMPYAVLISVVIGVTNIIPFFGPFIGGIPCGILVLVEDPMMCVVFVIFILVLQQLDGNIIGPLIIGDSTGLSGLWVMVSILVGGELFGFAGMLLGVPVFACLYTLFTILLRYRLKKKGLRNVTEDFMELRRFDEKTGKPIYGPKTKRVSMKKRKKLMQNATLQHGRDNLMKIIRRDEDKSSDTDEKDTQKDTLKEDTKDNNSVTKDENLKNENPKTKTNEKDDK